MRVLEGSFAGQGLNLAIVQARWNEQAGHLLLEGARDAFNRHGVESLDLVKVPGCYEIPLTAQVLCRSGRYDALVALGVLIRGGTAHFDLIASQVSQGIAAVSRETGVPIAFGVLTCETMEQALDRSGGKAGNKGFEAAMAAIEMVNLLRLVR
jgi:6,7-dimethyl-8-ribityllumazine synthase